MVLKPQDVYVALKIVAAGAARPPYAQLASELAMSPSEVHASVQRAQTCHLLHGAKLKNRPNISGLEEFLLHGLKYAFPPDRTSLTRGIPTSYAAPPLRKLIVQGDEPSPVWPYEEGSQRGLGFEPLYRTAPIAALRDPVFYEYLALADALRAGRTRERAVAETELRRRLKTCHERLEP